MKSLLKTELYRGFVSRRFIVMLISAAVMSLFGAVLVQQFSALMLSGELPKGTLSSFKTQGGYTLGMVRFGSVMQLRLLRTKDFITGLLCTEGMLILTAVMCVHNTSDLLRFGGAANAVSRGAKHGSVFLSVCISNILQTAAAALVCLVSFAAFTQLSASGFSRSGIADIEDAGIILRQFTELAAFAAMCTAVTVLLVKPLRSALTLISAVAVMPSVLSYMKIMYGTDYGISGAISFVRMLRSGMLLPNIGDVTAAALMMIVSIAAGIYFMSKARPKS